ncbi:twin-arginine translocation signal domain-containing protein [Haloarchaeobius sp. HME9146]|uniref:twin-arginine translocation signal domain-containing protein n=1 Tax=Haloarchaeobius sp. HME9146 TaxID=2978732 RepID=UPI0021C07D58|nr:twin-arginine translocation signal domain-containing protein [Haloarchaeobius sp. HME9146]MCT9094692.1 twin-arginine translocation signal domain-containing protein [Haloarchaeobius sp. HME9146]
MVSRRNLLGSVAAAGAVGLAATRFDLWPDLPTSEEPPEDSVLCSLEVMNKDDEAHTVSVTVEQDGEILTDLTRDLDARESRNYPTGFVVSENLPTDPGQFVLTVTLDGEQTKAWDSRTERSGALRPYAIIEEDSVLRLVGLVDPPDTCPTETAP